MGTVNEKLSYLSGTKTAIAAAIAGKGVTVPQGATFRSYAGLISSIDTQEPVLVSKSVSANGTYQAAGDNADGYSSVTVNVQPNLQQKTVTRNGTVTPDSGYDGLSQVAVNVSGGQADMVKLCVAGVKSPVTLEKNAYFGPGTQYDQYISPADDYGRPAIPDVSQPFEIGMTFRVSSNSSYEKYIWGPEDSYGLPTLIMKDNNFLCKYPISASSASDGVNLLDTDAPIPVCTNLFAKVTWDGTDLTYFVDTGANQYTKILTPEDPSYMHCSVLLFGTAAYSSGGIAGYCTRYYMRRSYIKQSGVLIWGFDDSDWTAHAKLLDFDFTQSLTDSVRRFPITTQNVTRDGAGLCLTGTNSYAELRDAAYTIGMSYELDVGATAFTAGSQEQYLFSVYTWFGLNYSSGRWELYVGDRVTAQETDPHYLDNCTIRLYVDSNARWHVYRNGVLWLESQESMKFGEAHSSSSTRYFALGSSSASAPGAVITGLRVYEGNNGSV